MMNTLKQTEHHVRLLADATRVRLLKLLSEEPLTVAELTEITQLAQSRVSTHLGKLREAGLVSNRKNGTSSYYLSNLQHSNPVIQTLWQSLTQHVSDPSLVLDEKRRLQVLQSRHGKNWADSVAGRMERHYSPGRTWEATAQALTGLLQLGKVLDIAAGDGVLAQLLAPNTQHITCLDISQRVITAGRQRLAEISNVDFLLADMHLLPLIDNQFDQVFLMNALSYSQQVEKVFAETYRVLKPGARLTAVTLSTHQQADAAKRYGHFNLGFQVNKLKRIVSQAGLHVRQCEVTGRERLHPYFEIITLQAEKPS